MKRRRFLATGCVACASLSPLLARAQAQWQMPARMVRPDVASDEGGLWAMMDREEGKLRRSPFALSDGTLREYVQSIVCRLAGEHCADVRVHVVRNRAFNASMAPNGMMQVWSGLLLRVDNEAQLAAVLGHEIGHYVERHGVEQLRDVKARSAFGQFLGLFGLVGVVGQVALIAGRFAYSRDQERQADRIGLELMSRSGYAPSEAAKIWENLLLEAKANPEGDPRKSSPLFATHPAIEERMEVLRQLASSLPAGTTNDSPWLERLAPFRHEWLNEEIKRGQFEESVALLTRLIARSPSEADYAWARAEVYRLRGKESDLDPASEDYQAAIALGNAPPEAYRGLGLIYRRRNQTAEAKATLARYLELAPEASDAAMIKSYVEELGA
jgi:predicted Zn-dependent protease